VDHGGNLEECISELEARLRIEVDVEATADAEGSSSCSGGSCEAEGEAEAGASASCNAAPGRLTENGVITAGILAAAFLLAGRRRKTPSVETR
jgi:hypothetical protein